MPGILMRAEMQFRNYVYLDNQSLLSPPQLQSPQSPSQPLPSEGLDSISSSANNSPSKILSLPGLAPLYQDLLVAQSTATASGPGLASAAGPGLDYDGATEWDNGDNDNDWGMGGGMGEGQVIGDGDYDMTPAEDPQVRHMTPSCIQIDVLCTVYPHPHIPCTLSH